MSHDRDSRHLREVREGEAPAEPPLVPASPRSQPRLLDRVRDAIRVRHDRRLVRLNRLAE